MDRYAVRLKTVSVKVREGLPSKICLASDAAALIRSLISRLDQDQEHFLVLALDVQNRPLGYRVVASGGMSEAQVDTKLVFRSALLLGGSRVIVAHNHPSGDPEPSADDVAVTRRLVAAGEILDVEVLDHIITGADGRWVSLKQRGLGML